MKKQPNFYSAAYKNFLKNLSMLKKTCLIHHMKEFRRAYMVM